MLAFCLFVGQVSCLNSVAYLLLFCGGHLKKKNLNFNIKIIFYFYILHGYLEILLCFCFKGIKILPYILSHKSSIVLSFMLIFFFSYSSEIGFHCWGFFVGLFWFYFLVLYGRQLSQHCYGMSVFSQSTVSILFQIKLPQIFVGF